VYKKNFSKLQAWTPKQPQTKKKTTADRTLSWTNHFFFFKQQKILVYIKMSQVDVELSSTYICDGQQLQCETLALGIII
jgi:hypothetical protein